MLHRFLTPVSGILTLEQHLQSELKLAGCRGRGRNTSRHRRNIDEIVRIREVRVIGQIEGFRTELQVEPVRQSKSSHHCGVEIDQIRALNDALPSVTKLASRRDDESRWV